VDGIKTNDLILYGALAIAAYLIYRAVSGVVAPIAAGVSSGVSAATSGIANLWVSLTAAPAMGVLGTVQFPDGSQAALASLPIKQDASGGIYTNRGGITYQLQPWVLDATGNSVYPAVAVGT
jgi:hypothetical protein